MSLEITIKRLEVMRELLQQEVKWPDGSGHDDHGRGDSGPTTRSGLSKLVPQPESAKERLGAAHSRTLTRPKDPHGLNSGGTFTKDGVTVAAVDRKSGALATVAVPYKGESDKDTFPKDGRKGDLHGVQHGNTHAIYSHNGKDFEFQSKGSFKKAIKGWQEV